MWLERRKLNLPEYISFGGFMRILCGFAWNPQNRSNSAIAVQSVLSSCKSMEHPHESLQTIMEPLNHHKTLVKSSQTLMDLLQTSCGTHCGPIADLSQTFCRSLMDLLQTPNKTLANPLWNINNHCAPFTKLL